MIVAASITYWLSGVGPSVWILRGGERGGQFYATTGTLTGLLAAYLEGKTPVGVVLDRMQECPEEVKGMAGEVVAEVVSLLRARHPNGV